MPETRYVGDLEIQEDLALERRTWMIERIGWACMALVLLAALLGAFGGGVLGKAHAGSDEGALSLEYPRLGRLTAPETLEIEVQQAQDAEGTVRLWFDREYLNAIEIQRIVPEPDSSEAVAGGTIFVFGAQPAPDPVQIRVHFRPERFGRISGRMGMSPDNTLSFNHFVYP